MPWKLSANPKRFDEAIEAMRKRVPMTKEEWLELEGRARERAFTVAGIAQLDVLAETKQSIVDAMEDGQTLQEWKDAAKERLETAWAGSVKNPAHRLETIYRTNLQTQYSRGHELQADHPAVRRHRPYKRFVAMTDTDTTEVCLESDGTVLLADDPWWDSHTPPLHFNCRSTVVTLSPEEAEEYGITKTPTDLGAQEGFGSKPQPGADPDLERWANKKLEKVDAQLADIYRKKEEAWQQAEAKRKKEAEQALAGPARLAPKTIETDAPAPPKPKKKATYTDKNGTVHNLNEHQQEAQQNAWWLNGDSDEAKRARAAATFEERRDWLTWDWVQNSNNRTGVSVREAARREFGIKGILWNPNRHELLSDESLNLIQDDLRRIYEATQTEFRRRGITHVKLWRGVRGDEPKPAHIRAFTGNPAVAREFGTHGEYHALVPVSQILFWHEAEGWVDGVYGQQSEFLLMANAPGESSGTPEFFVSRTKVAGKKMGWHASEGGAP